MIDELCEIGERGAFVPETLESFFLRVKKVMNFLASRERQQTVLVVRKAREKLCWFLRAFVPPW